ncbi:MAG: helix-turn-helix domain-containing protein [Deltaproteobacteria bacterium]|nr:helix-turn-helix domain-containing protein [Deltaproteobacteria bacterium]
MTASVRELAPVVPIRGTRAPVEIDTDGEVMDADQVAALLRVNRKTVYDYAGRGQIPCRRLGKRMLFSRTALMAWLTACKDSSRVNGA